MVRMTEKKIFLNRQSDIINVKITPLLLPDPYENQYYLPHTKIKQTTEFQLPSLELLNV